MARIKGTEGNDTLNGTLNDDFLVGLAGDDSLNGRRGDDVLNGGVGVDTAVYADVPMGYRFARNANGLITVEDACFGNGNEGFDTLKSMERIQFSDRTWTVTGEFRVNTFTENHQQDATMAGLSDGGFVVAWTSINQDGSGYGVYGQRYDTAGTPVGTEFLVNTTTVGSQWEPAVTALKSGGFVVTWTSDGQDGSFGIYGQRYNRAGVAMGGEFQVNTATAAHQSESAVAALEGGGFVVTWTSEAQDGSGSGVYGQRYDRRGATLGGEFLVNTTTASYQLSPTVTALGRGGFVVAWASYEQDGVDYGIYGQRYTQAGIATGAEFRINSTTAGTQYEPVIAALNDGGFVVVWNSYAQDGSGVYGQRYSRAGVTVGGEFLVNTTTVVDLQSPKVAGLSDGGFVVTWNSLNQETTGSSVHGRRYGASGVAMGGEFQVASTSNSQYQSAIAAVSDGGFVVTWGSNNQDGSGFGVYGQRYDANGQVIVGSTVQGSALADVMDFSDSESAIKLAGGLGDDTYILGQAADLVDVEEQADEGIDSILSARSYVLDENVENLTLTGFANLNGTGNALNNRLVGNEGDNVLNGGAGTDTAVYADTPDGYHFSRLTNGQITLTDINADNGNEGVDTLNSIEVIQFEDRDWTVEGEFRINTTTTGEQDQPTMATLKEGGFVVAWISEAQDGSGFGVYGQRYAQVGVATGTEFRINTTTASSQFQPAVSALSDGGFVVTWASELQDGSGLGVYGQRYGRTGVIMGAEFQVNTTTASDQQAPSVAGLHDGSMVVTWTSDDQDGSNSGVYGQRYSAAGETVGAEFLVNTTTTGSQGNSSIATLSDGSFIVTWNSFGESNSRINVYGQHYSDTGVAIGGEFKINTITAPISSPVTQVPPTVAALNDGGFVVAWGAYARGGFGYGVFGQRYTSTGVAVGEQFNIDTTTSRYGSPPTVTGLSDGGFVVTWGSYGTDGSLGGVYGQRYNAAGAAAGGEFLVNATTMSNQGNPVVTGLDDGGFMVAWNSSGQDGSGDGIYGQRFDANGQPIALIRGSALDDEMDFSDSAAAVVVYGAAGDDGLRGGVGDDNLSGGTGRDSIYGGEGDDFLDGGDGNDRLRGGAGNDILQGGLGRDKLIGGTGDDTYVMGRGDGRDIIVENDNTAGNNDVLRFLSGVARDQVWFKHTGNDLEVSIIGTTDRVSIRDWYSGSRHYVEEIQTASGDLLTASHVENLVSAMAGFSSRPAGATTLTVAEHAALDSVIAVSWS